MSEVEKKCAGCGLDLQDYRDRHELVRYGKTIYVCAGGLGTHHRNHRGKQACLRAAFSKPHPLCAVCGNIHVVCAGVVCSACRTLFDDAKRAHESSALHKYVIDAHIGPSLYYTSEFYSAIAKERHSSVGREEELAKLFAQCCATRGVEVRPGHCSNADDVITLQNVQMFGPYFSGWHGQSVSMTPEQAEACRAFVVALRDMLEAQRRAGRAEGKALLVGLAEGNISINELDERILKKKDV